MLRLTRLIAVLGRRAGLTFGVVTLLVSALLATVNITSRYALKVYVDDQLERTFARDQNGGRAAAQDGAVKPDEFGHSADKIG